MGVGTRFGGREVACPACKICRGVDACAPRRAVSRASFDAWSAGVDECLALYDDTEMHPKRGQVEGNDDPKGGPKEGKGGPKEGKGGKGGPKEGNGGVVKKCVGKSRGGLVQIRKAPAL